MTSTDQTAGTAAAPTTTTTTAPRSGEDGRPARRGIRHVAALDGLRGLAVIAVLAFHGGELRGGYLGVDLFFVLSGYLITALLLAESAGSGVVDLPRFWARRFRRLLPALVAMVAVVAVGSRWLADPLQWRAIRDDGLASLLYVANWHTIWVGDGYGVGVGGRSPLQHTWSLAIEEQFYLVWPVVVALLARRGLTARRVERLAVAVAVVSAGAAIALSFTSVSRDALYLGSHTRLAAVAIGAAVAARQATRGRRGRPAGLAGRWSTPTLAVAGGLAVLAPAWLFLDLDSPWLFRGGLLGCGLAAGAVVWGLTVPGAPSGGVLRSSVLREVGLRSYGLYLWHWPIFVWLDEARTGRDGLVLFGVRLVASVGAACASYELIEQPIRRGRPAPTRDVRVAAVAIFVATVVVAGAAVGAPPPLTIQAGGPALDLDDVSGADGRQVAVFGDSLGEMLASQGVRPLEDELGVAVRDGGLWGCQLMAPEGRVRDGEGRILSADKARPCALDFAEKVASLQPEPAVIVMIFGNVPFDVEIDGTWEDPCSAPYVARYRQRARQAIADLGATGVPLAVLLPVFARPGVFTEQFAITDAARRQACIWQPLRDEAVAAGVGLVDLRAHLCGTDARCLAEGPADDRRRDGVHFEGEDAQAIARWLIPEALRVARPTG